MNQIIKILTMVCLPYITIAQTALYNNGAIFFVDTGANIHVNGSIKNEAGSSWQNNGLVIVKDSFINNQNMTTPTAGTTRFSGSNMQVIAGVAPLQTYNVVFDNANGILLQNNIEVNNTATFTNGIVDAGGNNLVFKSGATLGNIPSNASHVNGHVVKEGTGVFTYPVGDATKYQPIDIHITTAGTSGMNVRYYTGYAGSGAYTANGSDTIPLVAHNMNEYWQCNGIGSKGTVTIYWDSYNNSGITNIENLKVAHLTGGEWLNEGTTATGTTSSGTVTSNSISTWSPFTLGTGCDTTYGSHSVTACDSYTWNTTTYSLSGTYTYTFPNAGGCDSIHTLNLTINNSTSNSTTVIACDTFTWVVNGMIYSQSGTYTDTSLNSVGCTHIDSLNLTINASTSNSSSATACDTYTWSVNGMTYTQSGTYADTTTNSAGCPYLQTLNLTINSSTFNTKNATACDTYTWSVNGTAYTQSGTYTLTSTNSNGCTHTETLNLTIDLSTSNTTNITACDTYTWSVNGASYTQSGTYSLTTPVVAFGCPHTEILNLTINASTSNLTTDTACGSYTWIVNGAAYTQSGTYTDTSINSAGCSHIETLNLTIHAIPVVTAPNIASCYSAVTLGGSPAGGIWDLPNPYSGTATSYSYYFTDANGCTGSGTGIISQQVAIITNLQVGNITGINAMVTWTGNAPRYDIRYKVATAGSWNPTVTSNAPNKLLSGLTANTNYTVEVRGYCTVTTPGSWVGASFTTNNICVAPTGLNVSALTGTTATLNWLSTGAGFYTVRYKKISLTSWTTSTTTSLSKAIAGLSLSIQYEFQVNSHCGTSNSGFSASTLFTTGASPKASGSGTEVDDLSSALSIYPNPVHDELHIDFTSQVNGIGVVKILDMSGRVVKQVQANTEMGMNNIIISLGDLSDGIYTLRIMNNDEITSTTRITKY